MITEACSRVEYAGGSQARVTQLVADGILTVEFSAQANILRILRLMEKHADRPMDFADACLVRLSEILPDTCVWTTDSDFRVYRRLGRQVVRVLAPWQ